MVKFRFLKRQKFEFSMWEGKKYAPKMFFFFFFSYLLRIAGVPGATSKLIRVTAGVYTTKENLIKT